MRQKSRRKRKLTYYEVKSEDKIERYLDPCSAFQALMPHAGWPSRCMCDVPELHSAYTAFKALGLGTHLFAMPEYVKGEAITPEATYSFLQGRRKNHHQAQQGKTCVAAVEVVQAIGPTPLPKDEECPLLMIEIHHDGKVHHKEFLSGCGWWGIVQGRHHDCGRCEERPSAVQIGDRLICPEGRSAETTFQHELNRLLQNDGEVVIQYYRQHEYEEFLESIEIGAALPDFPKTYECGIVIAWQAQP